MSRVKDALGTALGILFLAICVLSLVIGGYWEIQRRRWCSRNYADCAQEKIQIALEASSTYASWIEASVVRVSALRDTHTAVADAWKVLKDTKAPAPYEDIHSRLLVAMKSMMDLTQLAAPPMGVDRDESIDPLVASIMKCQEELRQIQAEILEISGGPIPTPSMQEATPAPATPSPAVMVITYTVQAGDTLAKIAAEFGVTVKEIVEANEIEDPSLINVGQMLVIPTP